MGESRIVGSVAWLDSGYSDCAYLALSHEVLLSES